MRWVFVNSKNLKGFYGLDNNTLTSVIGEKIFLDRCKSNWCYKGEVLKYENLIFGFVNYNGNVLVVVALEKDPINYWVLLTGEKIDISFSDVLIKKEMEIIDVSKFLWEDVNQYLLALQICKNQKIGKSLAEWAIYKNKLSTELLKLISDYYKLLCEWLDYADRTDQILNLTEAIYENLYNQILARDEETFNYYKKFPINTINQHLFYRNILVRFRNEFKLELSAEAKLLVDKIFFVDRKRKHIDQDYPNINQILTAQEEMEQCLANLVENNREKIKATLETYPICGWLSGEPVNIEDNYQQLFGFVEQDFHFQTWKSFDNTRFKEYYQEIVIDWNRKSTDFVTYAKLYLTTFRFYKNQTDRKLLDCLLNRCLLSLNKPKFKEYVNLLDQYQELKSGFSFNILTNLSMNNVRDFLRKALRRNVNGVFYWQGIKYTLD